MTPKPIDHLPERIRSIRQILGMSQNDLAERLGLPQPAVARLESGHRRLGLEEAVEIAALAGVSVEQLVDPSPLPLTKEV